MSIKSDNWIRQQCLWPSGHLYAGMPRPDAMIEPFEPTQIRYHERKVSEPLPASYTPTVEESGVKHLYEKFLEHEPRLVVKEKVISYGVSSYGYDIRCADEFKVFTNVNSTIVDPKNFDPASFVEVSGKGYCIIPPNSFALARTVERFNIPRNVLAICLGKSTYARVGLVVNVTPLEPEWSGYLTLEFSNTTPLPAKVYANEGCAQLLFFEGDPCDVSYKDRNGKYQDQAATPTPPRT